MRHVRLVSLENNQKLALLGLACALKQFVRDKRDKPHKRHKHPRPQAHLPAAQKLCLIWNGGGLGEMR